MDNFCRNDITGYLLIFAKHFGVILDHNDKLVNGIVDQIEARINGEYSSTLFKQELHSACKKCKLRYSERGDITKKEYEYCIRTDNVSESIPDNCPINSMKKTSVFVKVEDEQDIIDIRKLSKR